MEPPPIGPLRPSVREDRVALGWLARLAGRLLAAYIRLVARTARFSGPPISQEQVIFAVWHESNLLAAVSAYRLRHDNRAIVFSTRGFRGIVMNTMLEKLGSGVVTLPAEGMATRAEAANLSRAMARIGESGWSLVISCDGPWGPYRSAKPGALMVARESGLPIQPWAISSRPTWRLRRRWDRHIVPLPFARMRVEEGTQLRVNPRDRIKPLVTVLQGELLRVQARADGRMEE
jgi:lysophospholipid acyltransferase (LPLAT)-like uncharacterized protein